MRLALAAPRRLPALKDRLPLLSSPALRRHLGEARRDHPRAPAGSPRARSATQRGHRRFPVGEEHRRGRSRARLRWRQADKGQKTTPLGRYGGLFAQVEGPCGQHLRPRRDKAASGGSEGAALPRLSHLWLDTGYTTARIKARTGGEGPGLDDPDRQAPQALGEGVQGPKAATVP